MRETPRLFVLAIAFPFAACGTLEFDVPEDAALQQEFTEDHPARGWRSQRTEQSTFVLEANHAGEALYLVTKLYAEGERKGLPSNSSKEPVRVGQSLDGPSPGGRWLFVSDDWKRVYQGQKRQTSASAQSSSYATGGLSTTVNTRIAKYAIVIPARPVYDEEQEAQEEEAAEERPQRRPPQSARTEPWANTRDGFWNNTLWDRHQDARGNPYPSRRPVRAEGEFPGRTAPRGKPHRPAQRATPRTPTVPGRGIPVIPPRGRRDAEPEPRGRRDAAPAQNSWRASSEEAPEVPRK